MAGRKDIQCIAYFDDESRTVKQFNRFGELHTTQYIGSYDDTDDFPDQRTFKHTFKSFDSVIEDAILSKSSGRKVLFLNRDQEELDENGEPTGGNARKIAREWMGLPDEP